jgi:Tfp pilus assembly protein PilV
MRTSRSGFTLIESCVASALLVAALAAVVGLLAAVARQRQGASCHAQAVIIADNLLEQLTAEPYDALTPERADEIQRAANAVELIPGGDAAIRLSDASGSLVAKRIEVEVTWRLSGTAPPSHHAVATWLYRREGGK